MRELIDSSVLLAANAVDAEVVVLYLEKERDVLEPFSVFSVRKDVKFPPVALEEGSLMRTILEKWPPVYVSADKKILEALPYKGDVLPEVFMAVPFKVGKNRALLCANSYTLYSFNEKQQKVFVQFAEFIKSLFSQESLCNKFFLGDLKFKMLSATLNLMLSEAPLNEKFAAWCEDLGVSMGVFFVKQGTDILPFLMYFSPDADYPEKISVGPRSLVYIAVERGESFIFDDEENEPFDGVVSYGAIAPVELKKGKGCLFLGSYEKGFFSKELVDLMEAFAKIIGYICFSEAESPHSYVGNAVEFRNQLRIMCNRASRDGRKLSVAMIRLANISKLREKLGFWEAEEKIDELITGLIHELFPHQMFWARVTESAFFALKFSKDKDSDKHFRKVFREKVAEKFAGEKVDTAFFLFPDDVRTYESLCDKLEKYVVQRTNRRLFG